MKTNQHRVSIPFKREGTFRLVTDPEFAPTEGDMFPFPSNGKAHSDDGWHNSSSGSRKVSIPFKREGSFRPVTTLTSSVQLKFPFPSNGKAHSDAQVTSKVAEHDNHGFHSLQTGRLIQTMRTGYLSGATGLRFPFPSNGKAHSDHHPRNPHSRIVKGFHSLQTGRLIQTGRKVEGLTLAGINGFHSLQTGRLIQTWGQGQCGGHWNPLCFNSLQTGRLIQTMWPVNWLRLISNMFQFPSNGKAHSDFSKSMGLTTPEGGFHSLQTGRLIQTKKPH